MYLCRPVSAESLYCNPEQIDEYLIPWTPPLTLPDDNRLRDPGETEVPEDER